MAVGEEAERQPQELQRNETMFVALVGSYSSLPRLPSLVIIPTRRAQGAGRRARTSSVTPDFVFPIDDSKNSGTIHTVRTGTRPNRYVQFFSMHR